MSDLIADAQEARAHAYAPYSGYRVGAAIQTRSGRVFVGANVENVSYGATLCAEQAAVAAMVTAGEREIAEVAVATRDGGTPCGICRQMLAEFAPNPQSIAVHCGDESGHVRVFSLSELLPEAFRAKLNRTDRPNEEVLP